MNLIDKIEGRDEGRYIGPTTDAYISNILYTVLSRRYLDRQLYEIMQPFPSLALKREEPIFLRLEQIGKPLNSINIFAALQNVLTSCHAPGRFSVVFLLASNGGHNSIYIGVQSHDKNISAQTFLRSVGNFFEANLPGTQLSLSKEEIFLHEIKNPMEKDLNYAVALTGVPSLRENDVKYGYPQTLDRLLNGMRGRRFIYMVIAQPMSIDDVDDIIFRCHGLTTNIHSMIKTSITQTTGLQKGVNEGTNVQVGLSEARAHTYSKTSLIKELEKFVKETAQVAATSQGMHLGFEKADKETFTDTKTINISSAHNIGWNLSLSSGESLGQEYINSHVQAVEIQLQQFIKRFEQSRMLGCWNTGVYLFAERPDIVEHGALQIKSLITGDKNLYEPIRIHDLTNLYFKDVESSLCSFRQPNLFVVKRKLEMQKEISHADKFEHILGEHFNGLSTPINTEELALLTNLPQREIIGIPIVATAPFSLNVTLPREGDTILGNLLDTGRETNISYPIPLSTLVKHTFITGITGSGKSNTCLRILEELIKSKIPFLVIEPAKDEYVKWAMEINNSITDKEKHIRIYMPGVKDWRGIKLEHQLHLNPLDIVWLSGSHNPSTISHVDRLKSILNASFPMQEVLPILLEDLLFTTYSKPFNWLEDKLPVFDRSRPTLREMSDMIRDVVRQKGYDDSVTSNLTAALTTRIQSLRHGWKGKLFDQSRSTPWADIFDKPVIINLSQIGDRSDRAFTMAILLQFLYEYRQAQFDTETLLDSSSGLRHLTVVEEAHRILQRSIFPGQSSTDPQGKVAEMFSDILSEIRAYGEGLMIVDQVPVRLIPDVIKNTNLKIVHRLVATDDRDTMSGCMNLTSEQTALINNLRIGQAIVYGDKDNIAALVKIALHKSSKLNN